MPIDLSAGLVPKSGAAPGGVDLSAGLVAKQDAAPQQPMSMIQRARAYVDRLSTVQDDPNASAASNALSRFGAGVIANTAGVLNHPYDAAQGFVQSLMPDPGAAGMAERVLGPAGPMVVHIAKGFVKDPANAAGGLVGGALLGEAAAPIVSGAAKMVARAPEAAKAAVVGSNIDRPIPGEAVTPRQQYQIAKGQGVNLDVAQATGNPLLATAKKVTNATIGGAPAFDANFRQNLNALQIHADNLLDQATPQAMSREDFGNTGKTKLLEDQAANNKAAGQMFSEIDDSIGASKPNLKGVRAVAQQIVADNKGYFVNHPEMLRVGGAGSAWQIVNDLAKAPAKAAKPGLQPFDDGFGPRPAAEAAPVAKPDTWSDLQKMRSSLLDLTSGPEITSGTAQGWLKQLTGAVHDAMAQGAEKLGGDNLEKWEAANKIYRVNEETYDNPLNPLYHVVRAQDGMTAADRIMNLRPQLARQVSDAAPDLVPQMQRQKLSQFLYPKENEAPDLQGLHLKFKNASKEQLGGILAPDQMDGLEKLARTARMVYSTDNPSGTAIKAIPTAELMGAGGAFTEAGRAFVAGDPVTAGLTALAPVAYYGATRLAAKALNSPAVADALTFKSTPKPTVVPPAVSSGARAGVTAAAAASGQSRWMQLGTAKLQDHIAREGDGSGLTTAELNGLRNTPQGQQLLIQAGDLDPGSKAMKNLVEQVKALKQ